MRKIFVLFTALMVSGGGLPGKTKHSKLPSSNTSQDEIAVAAHIPLVDGAVTRFFATEHSGHAYLYAEHASGKTVTLIDVTKTSQPAVLAEMDYSKGQPGNLVLVTGNAALVASNQNASFLAGAAPQTFRIMSFADPLHPTVKQEFTGVTAMGTDDKRGLLFLANAQGIWILQQQYAINPSAEKEWEHMMLDNR